MSSKKFRLAKEKKKEVYVPGLMHNFSMFPTSFLLLAIIGDVFALICYGQGQQFDKIFIGIYVFMNISVIFIIISKIYVAIAKAVEKRINKPQKD